MERDTLMNKSLTFTVAICSLNGEKHLPETLKVLFDQIPHGTKVIVVDDAITINHELFDAGFYPHHLIPEVRIPLHLQIIKDAALQLPLQR